MCATLLYYLISLHHLHINYPYAGAAEAFKAIGNAFAVLSDKDKRRQYDVYGAEDQIRQRSNARSSYFEEDYSRGFDSDISAEEIFNMFFGGGFPSGNVYVR